MKIVSILLATALASGPTSAPKDAGNPLHIEDEGALRHFTAGMDAWLAEDFAAAQRELEAAYAIEPVPELLYSLGQLARLQGDCTQARARFFAYLETGPSPQAAEDTRINIERCVPEEPELPEVAPPPEPEIGPPIETPPPAPAPRRRDALGITLTVVGSALAITGAGLFGAAFAERRRADEELGVNAFERRVDRSRAEYWSGVGLATVGVAVLAGGIVRLLLVRHRARRAAKASASRR
jgi:hypothetical protein